MKKYKYYIAYKAKGKDGEITGSNFVEMSKPIRVGAQLESVIQSLKKELSTEAVVIFFIQELEG